MNSRRLLFAPEFTADFKKLNNRYHHIDTDLRPLLDELRRGTTPGDRLQGLDGLVYKVRLKNTDAQRGKSGGYRVIYYLQLADRVVLLTIYSKSDQSDIPTDVIRQIIQNFETDK